MKEPKRAPKGSVQDGTLLLRLGEDLKEKVYRLAKEERVSVADWIRRALFRAIGEKVCKVKGCPRPSEGKGLCVEHLALTRTPEDET